MDIQRCALACPGVRIDLQEMNSHGVLQAMSARVCRDKLSPQQFLDSRKDEGATEFLGDILY